MKKRIVAAAAIAAISLLAYPKLEQMAAMERGYSGAVFGGEEIILLSGIFLSVYIIAKGFRKQKKRSGTRTVAASHTESEQSESKSL